MPSRLRSETELITAAQSGDTAAFDLLVQRYQAQLYRLMVRACHHPDDAEEVAVEAFARAYEKLRHFEGRSSFVSWLGRIATNLCFRRCEKLEVPSEPLEDDRQQLTAANDNTPEQAALKAEMRRFIRNAIAELPEPDQTILRLRDIEELPASTVSACTGLTVPAVKARLHRARARLRARLNGYFL